MAEDTSNPFEFLLEKVIAYRPKPGDLVIFRHPGKLSRTAMDMIRESWGRATDGTGIEGVRAIVLEEGMTFDVVRPADGE